ncbi:DinB family protein [Ktedonosporobacter rubrisoli]|nr:DinB family protein [Ktedonosporobacter rubrisoli]
MDVTPWLLEQLRSSARGFAGTVEQIPSERLSVTPPYPRWLGEWSAARHVFHMLYHERKFPLAFARKCLQLPPLESLDEKENIAWQLWDQDVPHTLAAFLQARQNLLDLLAKFAPEAWEAPREQEEWGAITLRWTATKAYQHTSEHTHNVLRLLIFWDCAAYEEQELLKRESKDA